MLLKKTKTQAFERRCFLLIMIFLYFELQRFKTIRKKIKKTLNLGLVLKDCIARDFSLNFLSGSVLTTEYSVAMVPEDDLGHNVVMFFRWV